MQALDLLKTGWVDRVELLEGDCLELLYGIEDSRFSAVFSDPPYGLEFMGKSWDKVVPPVAVWREMLRICKPGAFALIFGGTRTFHRLAVNLEDAGWELRDTLCWLYGSGFSKGLDVSKALDKAAGAEREVVGKSKTRIGPSMAKERPAFIDVGGVNWETANNITAPATDEARQWAGYGTTIKPAWEPVILARKPLDGTVAANVLKHSCGALNIDGCRVGYVDAEDLVVSQAKNPGRSDHVSTGVYGARRLQQRVNAEGRWPANVIHDGSDEVLAGFSHTASHGTTGIWDGGGSRTKSGNIYGAMGGVSKEQCKAPRADSGSAARYFYCAKASPSERGEGNAHPTVKPLKLCEYLAKLLLLPTEGAELLVPYCGSGSEMIGALQVGWPRVTGIEQESEFLEIARRRLQLGQ